MITFFLNFTDVLLLFLTVLFHENQIISKSNRVASVERNTLSDVEHAAVITQSHQHTLKNTHFCTYTCNHAHTDTSIHPEKIATACSRQRCLCWHDWCPQSRRPLLLFLHPIKHKSVDMDQDLSAPTECIQTYYIQYIYTETTVDSVVKVFLQLNRLTVRKEMYAQVFSVCTECVIHNIILN